MAISPRKNISPLNIRLNFSPYFLEANRKKEEIRNEKRLTFSAFFPYPEISFL